LGLKRGRGWLPPNELKWNGVIGVGLAPTINDFGQRLVPTNIEAWLTNLAIAQADDIAKMQFVPIGRDM
jgi:hypothetical protein